MAKRVITDEEYRAQVLYTVYATRKVVKILFGEKWKKGALREFERFGVGPADLGQWERYGAPLWAVTEMRRILKQRRNVIDEALLSIPERPDISGKPVSTGRH